MHEYETTLNGGIITVCLDISLPSYMERLDSVWFEGVNITSILDKNTLTALDMEAEHALFSSNDGSDTIPGPYPTL